MLSRLLLLSAVALVTLSGSAHGQQKTLKEGQELDTEMYQSLPDFEDKGVMGRIRCGACQASVLEIAYGILQRENNANRPVREVEVVEIMEKVCETNMNKYGLLLDKVTMNPTEQWSNDENALRAKGGYITRIVQGICSDVANDYEEHIVSQAPKLCYVEGDAKKCSTRPLIVDICGAKGFAWCTADSLDASMEASSADGLDAARTGEGDAEADA